MERIKREDYLSILRNFKDQQIIKVITGIRRCGKSTLLELFQDYLKENGVEENQIISINFEDADYEELQDRKKLYEYLKSKLVKGKKTYIFLDEIQKVGEFEKTVDSLFINKDVDLYITGSNAWLLSSELATLLTGRYIEIKMLPLSFKEYLSAFEDKTDLSRKFRDYLRYSSFPQAIELFKINPENINLFLDGIYNTILFKDVMQRKGITDKNTLERVTKYLYDNIGNRTSMKNISDNIEGLEKNNSYNTVSTYVQALIDSYIVYKANRYDIKGKEFLKTQEKYYAVDIGLRYYMLGQGSGKDMGHILENVVYLELLRRGYEVYIGKYDDLEVDFVAKNSENTIYYQVALTTRESAYGNNIVLERELAPLKKISDNYPKYILTLDDDLDVDFDGIKKINVLDWLIKEKD
ncbi:MAG: ATP-binding protein [Clostridia bacterium]|nr:ATP-binding protein [Clostridia bacterium]